MALNIFSINNIWSRNKQPYGKIGEVINVDFLSKCFKQKKSILFMSIVSIVSFQNTINLIYII